MGHKARREYFRAIYGRYQRGNRKAQLPGVAVGLHHFGQGAETIIFLNEALADFLQGIAVPRDEPSEDRKGEGYSGFLPGSGARAVPPGCEHRPAVREREGEAFPPADRKDLFLAPYYGWVMPAFGA